MIEDWNRDVDIVPPNPPFRRFQLIVSYFGPAHFGWQRQDSKTQDDRSVQGFIERAIYKISGEYSTLYGSGRTDSGVHALGQCAHFDSKSISFDTQKLRMALNANLPKTIRINDVIERYDAFHARFSTFLREYEYIIKNDVFWTPFDEERAWHLNKLPSIDTLNAISSLIVGDNVECYSFDFTKLKDEHSTRRDIPVAKFDIRDNALFFNIIGNAFLYHMVRSIVGTCVKISLKYTKEQAREKFLKMMSNREKAKFVAPAHGLYLKRIIYDKNEYQAILHEM